MYYINVQGQMCQSHSVNSSYRQIIAFF